MNCIVFASSGVCKCRKTAIIVQSCVAIVKHVLFVMKVSAQSLFHPVAFEFFRLYIFILL